MPTIARDPMLAGRPEITPASVYPPRSELPPGGNPQIDLVYERWLNDFVDMANLRWCDKYWPAVPRAEILKTYQLTSHLYKWLIGCEFPAGHGPNYLHRMRFVAVQHRLRPAEIEAESRRYLVELIDLESAKDASDR